MNTMKGIDIKGEMRFILKYRMTITLSSSFFPCDINTQRTNTRTFANSLLPSILRCALRQVLHIRDSIPIPSIAFQKKSRKDQSKIYGTIFWKISQLIPPKQISK